MLGLLSGYHRAGRISLETVVGIESRELAGTLRLACAAATARGGTHKMSVKSMFAQTLEVGRAEVVEGTSTLADQRTVGNCCDCADAEAW